MNIDTPKIELASRAVCQGGKKEVFDGLSAIAKPALAADLTIATLVQEGP